MRTVLACLSLLAFACTSLALTPATAPTAPSKVPALHTATSPDAAVIRQGGDTIADATVVPSLPFDDTGTTTGYSDDYDEACPWGSLSPDVVYAYTPTADVSVTLDLCGSSYDTKLYVYDESLTLVACNDDYYFDSGDPCGQYVSKLEDVPLLAGMTYYWVVDGYGGDSGDYVLAAASFVPCELDCPVGGLPEGEPPLQDDQINAFNDGCGSDNPDGFQPLAGDADGELVLCGTSGWFQYIGSDFRDTDWFVLTFGPDGVIEVTADAEQPLYVFELGPQDCNDVTPVQQATAGPCAPASMTITGDPFATVWFWTGATTFSSPDGSTPYEYDYVIWFSGLAPAVVATESHTWGEVKALFD